MACRFLYDGKKNFFNKADSLCYEIVICEDNEVNKYYDAENNECILSND